MDDGALQIGEGEVLCRFSDASVGTVQGVISELGAGGARMQIRQPLRGNPADVVFDVTIEVRGVISRQFFAGVAEVRDNDLRLRWLTIDPGQPARLRAVMDAYRSRHRSAPGGTARITKPATSPLTPKTAPPRPAAPEGGMVITPFGAATPATTSFKAPAKPSATTAPLTVFAPTPTANPLVPPPAPVPPPVARANDDAQAHKVVIAPTSRYERLAPEPEAEAQPAVQGDGPKDLAAALRSKARTVRASELAARHDRVNVLNMATIRALMNEEVQAAVGRMAVTLNDQERKRLLEEAEEGFQERMKAFQLEKASAEERSKQLADQLQRAQQLLEDERKRTISADQFTVSNAGMAEIEGSFQRMIDRAAASGGITADLESQLRKLASHVFDDERQRIREKEMQAQNDKIDLLEKKIRRLAVNLEDVERQRDEAREIAAALEKSAGQGMTVDQIKQKFQVGLEKDDPRREQKMAIMRELLEQNRELRRKLGLPVNESAASSTPAAASPVVGAAVEAEPATAATDEEASTEAAIDPDDLPWEPTPAAAAGDDGIEDRGIKVMRDFKRFEPPPLVSDAAPTTEAAAPGIDPDDLPWEPAAPEVDPDDLPWEPPAATPGGAAEADDRGVKVMRDYKRFEPPPLRQG